MNYKTKRVVTLGLLLAMEIVLSRFLSFTTPIVKVGFAFLPIVAAAVLYGSWWASGVAALGDLLGALLFPTGPYFFGFTLTAFLTGLVFGFLLYNRTFRVWRAVTAAGIVCILLNFGLDSLWLHVLMEQGAAALLPTRAIKAAVMLPVEAGAIVLLHRFGGRYINEARKGQKDMYRQKARRLFKDQQGMRTQMSGRVEKQVLSGLPYKAANTLFCYVGTERELETRSLILRAMLAGKRVCVPRCEENGEMTARYITSMDDLQPGRFGIDEPSADAPIADKADIDLAIVPCAVCDGDLNRLGWGKGYYDRYLADTAMEKAALCPSLLIVQRLYPNGTDVAMDFVITEDRAYCVRNKKWFKKVQGRSWF